jgi:hypothetical protein
MKNNDRTPRETERPARKPAEHHDDGVLESLGKAISSPIAGAAEDDLLPREDAPVQRKSSDSKRP